MYQIKDWSKFQHYKTGRGAPPWIKLYRDLLNDREWFALEPEAAKFLVSCWLIAAEYDGNLPDSETLAFRLRLASKEVVKLLSLCKHWIIQDDSIVLAKRYQLAIPETETESEEETEREKRESVRGRGDARGTRLPPDWKPKPEDPQSEQELAKFRDYWAAVAGAKGVKRDWDATWRNWIRNSKQWVSASRPNASPPETYRIGHPRGVVKPEPEAPKLTPEQLAERARFVEQALKGFGRVANGNE